MKELDPPRRQSDMNREAIMHAIEIMRRISVTTRHWNRESPKTVDFPLSGFLKSTGILSRVMARKSMGRKKISKKNSLYQINSTFS